MLFNHGPGWTKFVAAYFCVIGHGTGVMEVVAAFPDKDPSGSHGTIFIQILDWNISMVR